jgi:hypothetical protein
MKILVKEKVLEDKTLKEVEKEIMAGKIYSQEHTLIFLTLKSEN